MTDEIKHLSRKAFDRAWEEYVNDMDGRQSPNVLWGFLLTEANRREPAIWYVVYGREHRCDVAFRTRAEAQAEIDDGGGNVKKLVEQTEGAE